MQSTIFTEIVYILLNFFLLAKPLYGDLGMGSYLFEDLLTSNSSNEVYNKFHRPGYNDSTVNVSVFIHLESMRDISSETTLDFYLLQFWQDPRLIPKTGPLKVSPWNFYVFSPLVETAATFYMLQDCMQSIF